MILFFGGGYCTEFLVPLLGEKKIISTHSRIPYKAQFKDFDFVERYKLNDFLKQKKKLFSKNYSYISIHTTWRQRRSCSK